VVLGTLALLGIPMAAGAITGVCPDGSVFIVQSAESVPCKHAKEVDPSEIPPLRPEHLPRPYTWKVYDEAQNPNNPYFLIDAAREVRAMRAATPEAAGASAAEADGRRVPAASGPRDLGLAEDELRDLYLIVELSQEHALASFLKESADGRELIRVSFAHSQAFEDRFHEAHGSEGSPVLLFSAVAREPEAFHPLFSFVQGHIAFHPEEGNLAQLGVLQGRLGDLDGDEAVLGYVVLPPSIDLTRPIDVYWNDRLTTVTFSP
jgi:hypothetical protein